MTPPRIFKNPYLKSMLILAITGTLAACGEPRAVMLPLQYPNGAAVRTTSGEPVMAGFQTYGSATHANATALYEQARPPTCATCARVGAVVTEPSTLRQVTGVVGTAAIGSGAVMTGIGVMDYGQAAKDGKLGTNVTQNAQQEQSASLQASQSTKVSQTDIDNNRYYGGRHHW